MDEDSDRLLSVAGALAEGDSVSWDDEARLATGQQDLAALHGLRDLERVVAAHRHIGREYDTASTTGNYTTDGHEKAPERWAHLVILEAIGDGSFGTVYRAYDSHLHIDVALKLVSISSVAPESRSERLLQEARLLARVRHPNVVRVYGADQTHQRIGLWMELIKGRTLEELLRRDGPFSAHEASLVGRDVCRALAAVHQAGVLHGDIKAHNVMREEGGRTVLMDFGAGQALDAPDSGSRRHLTGTPAYLAPEVLDGQPRGTSTDIYALGVLLYHLVTDSYPLIGQSMRDLVAAHKRGERRHLRDARPDLPDDFVRVVEQATAAEPSQRFVSLGALEDALVGVTSPIPSARLPVTAPARPLLSRIPRWVMVLTTAVVVAGGASSVWLLRSNKAASSLLSTAGTGQTSTEGSGAGAVGTTYEIDAAFYRASGKGEQVLRPDSRVAPGDELFLKFQASVPINVYVVNEDERGAAFLLFPLPGQALTNPLPAGRTVTLPGATHWQVNSPGVREHFLIFASPDPMESFEHAFAGLPTPKEGAPVAAVLPPSTVERLRGVGGLTPTSAPENTTPTLSRLFTTPLTDARERARGLWVRQITLDNPAR